MGARRALLIALLWTQAACAPDVNRVQLRIARSGDNLAGFTCRDSPDVGEGEGGRFLVERAIDTSSAPRRVAFSLVVDFVRLEGVPSCRGTQLFSWCSEHDCAPLHAARTCVEFDQASFRGRASVPNLVEHTLAGQVVSLDAPDEPLLVRVVGTTQTCAEVDARPEADFDEQTLIGCAYSCPLVPDTVRGEVVLDLDAALIRFCEAQVLVCASPSFSPEGVDSLGDLEPPELPAPGGRP